MGAAVVPGTSGNDTLSGATGADSLYGKGGNDRLLGLAGNDLLVGGAGDDRLAAGPGSDRLSCGPGRDTANADPNDRVGSDCESVKGIPKPTPEPEPTPEPPPLPASGQKIDVGGYRLYRECAGSGSPTVILATGGPSASLQIAGGWSRERVSPPRRAYSPMTAGVGSREWLVVADQRTPEALRPTPSPSSSRAASPASLCAEARGRRPVAGDVFRATGRLTVQDDQSAMALQAR